MTVRNVNDQFNQFCARFVFVYFLKSYPGMWLKTFSFLIMAMHVSVVHVEVSKGFLTNQTIIFVTVVKYVGLCRGINFGMVVGVFSCDDPNWTYV